jgi:hypothetical protein
MLAAAAAAAGGGGAADLHTASSIAKLIKLVRQSSSIGHPRGTSHGEYKS